MASVYYLRTIRTITFDWLFLAAFVLVGFFSILLPVAVAEASSGGEPHEVQLCHVPLGNPEHEETITVVENSTEHQGHLAHGDTEGPCESEITIVATKVVCDTEADLPNWGLGGPNITPSTALDYVAAHPGCHLASNWYFQWGFGAKPGHTGVRDLSGDFVGEANGSYGAGTNTGTGYSDWKTFGPTNSLGVASVSIQNLHGATRLWVREVLQDGFVPFTYYPGHKTNADDVTAELYCHTDVLNYDNYDFVLNPVSGATYHCVAFNAPATPPPPVNHKPIITLLGALTVTVTQESTWTDPGATVSDDEDGDITWKLVTAGNVDTNTLGTYTITYNATDSAGLAADEQTRTVVVVAACADGTDNDGDSSVDFPNDLGCSNPEDNDENTKPVITLLGANPLELVLNATFVDPGADATDAEDCIGKTQEECNVALNLLATGVVDTSTIGTYTITYTAQDSGHLDAVPVTRTVNVNPPVTECNDGVTNDMDAHIDYPDDHGCTSADDNDENEPPTIVLRGSNPMIVSIFSTYTEPMADVEDPEEGDIDSVLVIGGMTVDTSTLGTYTVTYDASDGEGASAVQQTRTVVVVAACADGTDNDGDSSVDFPADPGCTGPDDNDESDPVTNHKPIITLLGALTVTVTQGSTWTDPGATVSDDEDGDITWKLVTAGNVDTNTLGTYTITYNATDSAGLAADEQTRTVIVVSGGGGGGGGGGSVPPACADGTDNDGDTKSDYPADPGCESSIDDNETDVPPPGGGGGGGGGTPTLVITNERIQSTGDNSVVVTWDTNIPATSRVVYGIDPVATLGTPPLYGYGISTATATVATTSHLMAIDGIPSGTSTYFRPVSTTDTQTAIGIELVRGVVLGVTSEECFYLREYLRLGANNNPVEVRKLQTFLRDFEGFSTLPVTGFFDIETDRAVRIFQDRYATEVLSPWGLPGNTGYVYYTTQKKINEIYCARAFPLSDTQLLEITAFRALMEGTQHTEKSPVTENVVGANTPSPKNNNEAQQKSVTGDKLATAEISASVSAATTSVSGAELSTPDDDNENAVRLTISDILAVAPGVGEKLSTGTMTADPLTPNGDGAVAGVHLTNELAAVGEGISPDRILAQRQTYVTAILLLLLAVVVGGIVIRRRQQSTSQE